MAKYGLIYIIQNDMHPGDIYKVGYTTNSIKSRIGDLNRETSNPGTFNVCASFPVTDVTEAESRCHKALKKLGYGKDKEFFQASLSQIVNVVKDVCTEYLPKPFISDKVNVEGKPDGPWVKYYDNGQLMYEGAYKDGKQDGLWVGYNEDGQLHQKGAYKDGKRDGPWVLHHNNGQLMHKGDYSGGKKEGPWARYNEDGTINKRFTGTFKNDVKVSD